MRCALSRWQKYFISSPRSVSRAFERFRLMCVLMCSTLVLYTLAMRDIIPESKNPQLRKKAEPVAISDIASPKIRTLIQEMKDLLAKEQYGVALAAVQIGEPLRLFV